MKEYQKKYYQEHKEYLDEKNREYYITNREKILKYLNTYRKINRVELLERQRQLYGEKRKYIDDYKLSRGCSVCGYNKCASALEFHHNGDKDFCVAEGIYGNRNLKKIEKEINKCAILCANCHRELHNEILEGGVNNAR